MCVETDIIGALVVASWSLRSCGRLMSAGVSERLSPEGAVEIRLRVRAGAFLPVRYLAINYAAAQGGGPELLKTKLSLYGMALPISKVLMVK